MPRFLLLRLQEVIHETADAVTLRWTQPLTDRIAYQAGQYLTLKVTIAGEDHYRAYSISSAPRFDRYLSVTIKRVPGGLVSNYLCDHAAPGMELAVLQPRGRFGVTTATRNRRHLVLWAGGSGITPLYSILRAVLYHEPYSRVTLVYSSRTAADTLFGTELLRLSDLFGDRLSLHLLASRTSAPPLPWQPTRLTAEWVAALAARLLAVQEYPLLWMMCGPAGMMAAVMSGLTQAGVAPEAIQAERFDTGLEDTAALAALGPARTVQVVAGEQTWSLQVPPGTTLLQAAIAQEVPLPWSCKRGVCATCMCVLTRGQVTMADPGLLLDFERAAGKILTCQAFPADDAVVIQVQ
ncbi:MAG: ferredoxin--NADP reductase [Bacteroidia bacterium]|nr:ferredoxin--NADP reductase [Bacteroidia bacterium]